MKSLLKFIFGAAIVMGLLTLVFGLLVAVNLFSTPDMNVTINGWDVPFTELHPGHLLMGAMGIAIAAVVIVVVVPLSLILGLALPLLMLSLGLALGVLALVGVGALALSPVLILLLPLIWLARRNRVRR